MLAAVEAAIVLKLDAEIRCPSVGLTTTTRSLDFSLDQLRRAEQALWRQLRRELPVPLEYVAFLEWTTGRGTRSGGHRRPHLHHLVKGLAGDHAAALEPRVSELWRRYTADAWHVDCRPLRTPVGAIAYLALHHHKREQAPPPGFRGRRLRPSKGYYERPIAELRRLARELARHDSVVGAVKRATDVELYGCDPPSEYEADRHLSAALVDALRELQVDGRATADPRRELVDRTVAELERIRAEHPPKLVRVREREEIDRDTGQVTRRVVAILGPVERRRARPNELAQAA